MNETPKYIRKTVLAAVLALGFANPALAQVKTVDLITGPFSTGSYVLGNALEQISKSTHAPVTVSASETPGLVYNAKKLTGDPAMSKHTMMAFTSGINYLAINGEKPFGKKLPSALLIANYNLGSVWLATFDKNIKGPKDLIGKRIALGTPPQILWTIEPRLIIKNGWHLADKITIETLGTSQAAQALLNGTVDAAVIGGYANPETGKFLPSPQTVQLLASGRTLYHIPWTADAIKATIASGVPLIEGQIKAGAVQGLDKPMVTFYDAIAWAAYPNFDEEAAYQVTKMIIQNVGSFAKYHALGKLMSRAVLPYGWPENRIHPGALRAYREAGILK
jgi:uncharacterized protein